MERFRSVLVKNDNFFSFHSLFSSTRACNLNFGDLSLTLVSVGSRLWFTHLKHKENKLFPSTRWPDLVSEYQGVVMEFASGWWFPVYFFFTSWLWWSTFRWHWNFLTAFLRQINVAVIAVYQYFILFVEIEIQAKGNRCLVSVEHLNFSFSQ